MSIYYIGTLISAADVDFDFEVFTLSEITVPPKSIVNQKILVN